MELKKRLLDLSNTVQLHLPKLENVPELVPALRQLEIPVTTCFIDAARMRKALAEGRVPFLSLYGHWVPISGYDPGRDGFYYYSYGATGGQDWLRNEDTDLFYARPGESFGGEAEKSRSRLLRLSLQKFVPRAELEAHVMDIGGVGMILGDSAFAPRNERLAAFLVEQGDAYYQEHENYPEAAADYKRAGELFPCDQVDSRKLYLKRRYEEFASDTRSYQNLFQDFPPVWYARLGPDAAGERALVGKILAGKLGTYLMMNWYSNPTPDSSAQSRAEMDTALALFRGLRRLDPDEPIYVDSLAELSARGGNLKAADTLYGRLAAMYPFGNESACYRWAWTKLELGEVDALPGLLDQCKAYAGEAKYLTMRAAIAMRKHRWRAAYEALARSLKLDKSIGQTHALMADWYKRKGDERNMLVHQRWLRRST
jgi:tetratricopeptide (TPR) repeat protein